MSPTSAEGTALRRLMARWPTGVSVVTARSGDRDGGLTVNALLSVSLDPPTLLVSIDRDADTVPLIDTSQAMAVSFLGARQKELSERFARRIDGAEKFQGVRVHRAVTGAALLDGALGWIECRPVRSIPVADHLLYLGEVVHVEEGPDAPPLLFYHRGYATTEGTERLRLPPASPPGDPVNGEGDRGSRPREKSV
jgi:flavin reductase (DIM6/NTAB) family NADH-FMN oxidoreductase RutF